MLKLEPVTYSPIGIFNTSLQPGNEVPRQGRLDPENSATIEIKEEYRECLSDLEAYEYILVFYHLNLSEGWNPKPTPPGSTRSYGLFATRSPRRPNPIGYCIVKLERIENTTLYVRGVDAFNGTPVLDIKPYIPSIDYVKSEVNEKIEESLLYNNQKTVR
ncbi:MAG: tRNA (N6-threonylcarbamoyladenosine(37)-N6)-methyltransferase TrmO [Bacteroidales bacterium]|nr:tRNA (N6-threonylcarbamoyladenosine(37)-N6)-methyltransferase TrmO [Bacteroidales bacterium]